MRICFDLDKTLVSSPKVPNDYTTVEPLEDIVELARSLKKEGHTIIVYTARRMQTHKHNVGAVIKDVGKVTYETLEKYGIPFDELLFGKPIADIYIDDKAYNPFLDKKQIESIFSNQLKTTVIDKLPNNRFNVIRVNGNNVLKEGPSAFLHGEYTAYKKIAANESLLPFFPKFFSYKQTNESSCLEMEYISGISLYNLYKLELFSENHLDRLLSILDTFHSQVDTIDVTEEDIKKHYIQKFTSRMMNEEEYPFPDREEVFTKALQNLNKYLESNTLSIVPFIHGDFWFSNIILTYDNKIKCFDMRGEVWKLYTTSGDKLYDYAKLYQSILGYDSVLYNHTIHTGYIEKMKNLFHQKMISRGISLEYLTYITQVLVLGTINFTTDKHAKERIWSFAKNDLSTLEVVQG